MSAPTEELTFTTVGRLIELCRERLDGIETGDGTAIHKFCERAQELSFIVQELAFDFCTTDEYRALPLALKEQAATLCMVWWFKFDAWLSQLPEATRDAIEQAEVLTEFTV